MDPNTEWQKPPTEKIKKELDWDLIQILNQESCQEAENQPLKTVPLNSKFFVLLTLGFFLLFTLYFTFLPQNLPDFKAMFLPSQHFQADEIAKFEKSVVLINAMNKKGTGFNISPTGTILTNYHVVKDNSLIYVQFAEGSVFKAEKVQTFPDIDLAILTIAGKDLPFLEWSSSLLNTNDDLLIIGNPLDFSFVSVEGKFKQYSLGPNQENILVFSAPIYPGNSGSPILNPGGKVCGIVFASRTEDKETLGLGIPASLIQKKVPHLF